MAVHALTLLLAVHRKIKLLMEETRQWRWDYNICQPIGELAGRKLGIIGLGKIGRKLASMVKSLDLELPEEIINIHNQANPRVGIRAGGPVQTNQMMLLHTSDKIPDQTMEICEGVYLGGDLQFLQETITDPNGPAIHLCFGYAGWGAGQLEREFLDGGWFLYPATAHLLFDISTEKLWQ